MNGLTYDGFGINDSDDYATRLCTFAKGVPESRRKKLGAIFAEAPELLEACEELLRIVQIAMNAEDGDVFGIAHNDAVDAIGRAEVSIANAKGIRS